MTTLLYVDPRMIRHDPGPGHPERPDRLRTLYAALEAAPPEGVLWRAPRPATREAVERVHDRTHVDQVEAARGKTVAFDGDTVTSPDSVQAAWLAAGAATDAVDAVLGDEADSAVALVRPPGHHAERGHAMGFCFFNNVAVAAEHAVHAHGLERVLVVDWDVHHGNGTQHSFQLRRDVLFASTHQYPFYPGTGAATEVGGGEGEGFTVNVPLPGGQGDGDYALAFEAVIGPVADAFAPQLVLVSAGFDAHRLDPLGGMRVSDDGFAALCGIVQRVAAAHAGGRVVLLLEGGYDLQGLRGGVGACLDVLAGATPPAGGDTTRSGEAAVARALAVQKRYWAI